MSTTFTQLHTVGVPTTDACALIGRARATLLPPPPTPGARPGTGPGALAVLLRAVSTQDVDGLLIEVNNPILTAGGPWRPEGEVPMRSSAVPAGGIATDLNDLLPHHDPTIT